MASDGAKLSVQGGTISSPTLPVLASTSDGLVKLNKLAPFNGTLDCSLNTWLKELELADGSAECLPAPLLWACEAA